MANISVFSGRVISIQFKTAEELKTKSELLTFVIQVFSGEMKKETEQYPPSFILKVKVWGKRATALKDQLDKGMKLSVAGKLGVPEVYTSKDSGELRTTLVMFDTIQVDIYDTNATVSNFTVEAKATTSKKKPALEARETISDESLFEMDIPY